MEVAIPARAVGRALTRPPHVQEHEGTLPVEPAQFLEVDRGAARPPGTQMSSRPVPTMRSVRRVPSNAGKSITEPRTMPRRESSDRVPDGVTLGFDAPLKWVWPCSVVAARRVSRARAPHRRRALLGLGSGTTKSRPGSDVAAVETRRYGGGSPDHVQRTRHEVLSPGLQRISWFLAAR
jgi:hypothetical protein